MSKPRPRTPVNILTGFLGAGKTTLLNHLLQQGFGTERVAVVVNDFGKIAVDALLIDHEEEGILSLPNGCVCCTLAGDLSTGLNQLLQAGYDRIILEASGLTKINDLRTIIETPALAGRCFLESVTAVVDPGRFVKLRAVVATMDEQISGANVVILNRADLTSPEEAEAARQVVSNLNSSARILVSSFCKIDLPAILAASETGRPATQPDRDDHWCSYTIRFDNPLDRDPLQAALDRLPDDVFRLKGFVRERDGTLLHVEWVGGQARIEPWTRPVSEDSSDTLIVIGRETLTQATLEAVLTSCPPARYEKTQSDHSHQHGHDHSHH